MQQSMSSRDGASDGRRNIEIQGRGLDFTSRYQVKIGIRNKSQGED